MDEHLKTNEPLQDDLDVSERLEGSYILPGQPGYVSNSELRVHRLRESPARETAEATSGNIPDIDPAIQTRELTGPAEDRREGEPEVDRVKETVSPILCRQPRPIRHIQPCRRPLQPQNRRRSSVRERNRPWQYGLRSLWRPFF